MAQYIPLSHSWGGHHPIVTTQSGLHDHKQGIDLDSLPKTYQDVIVVTQRLGHRHLWIDSLCIIQDSKSDWGKEAGRKAEVYQNSWLTVSATRSTSPTSGCFNSPENQVIVPKGEAYNYPFILNTRHPIEHVTPDSGSDVLKPQNGKFPLLARGWAY
jgi:hypothetical protein